MLNKKIFVVYVTLVLLFSFPIIFNVPVVSALPFPGGSGTVADPYEISHWLDLNNIRDEYLDKNFILTTNLDSGSDGYNIYASESANGGEGWIPIGVEEDPFTGSFDGDNHNIGDLFIDRARSDCQGLFGYIEDAVIENVGLIDISVTGDEYVGGLVGAATTSTIENCYVGHTEGGNASSGFELVDTEVLPVGGSYTNIAHATFFDDGYVYVASYNGLNVYSFDDDSLSYVTKYSAFGYGVWGDGTYIYEACGYAGIRAYSFNGVTLSLITTKDDGGTYYDVWGDGTYIYVACGDNGLRAYSFNGVTFTLITTKDDGGTYYDVWGDGTYIYAACGDSGLRAYSFNGITFTLEDTDDAGGTYYDVWGDHDAYIYVACGDSGLRAYSFNGITFTLEDTDDAGGNYVGVAYDDNLIYVSCEDEGVRAYSFEDEEGLCLLDVQDDGGTYTGICTGDSEYIFVGCSTNIRAYVYVLPLPDMTFVSGVSSVGGLIGGAGFLSKVTNCYTAGYVEGEEGVGGLIGYGAADSVTNSHSSAQVEGVDTGHPEADQPFAIGGLIGYNSLGSIHNCYATGDVTVMDVGQAIGGLIGYSVQDEIGATIRDCYARGDVTGFADAGGLIGKASKELVINCYATGNVMGAEGVGGLIGDASDGSTIYFCYATGDVAGYYMVGGLVGYLYDSIIGYCYATGDVTIPDLEEGVEYVGGLVGFNNDGTIYISYATGDVYALYGLFVGGLIGMSGAGGPGGPAGLTVRDCYARGDVTGDTCVGGLIGLVTDETVYNCYSTGYVVGDTDVGGMVGVNMGVFNTGDIDTSYWDVETSGMDTSDGGTGHETEEMTYDYVGYDPPCEDLYEEWDLADYIGDDSIWVHDPSFEYNDGYPLFRFMIDSVEADFSFSPLDPEEDETVSFTDTSTGNIVNWSWDFGDGSNSFSENPGHIYAADGEYTVTLNVTGPDTTNLMLVDSFEMSGGFSVWCDENYVYIGNSGIAAFSFNGAGLTLLDSIGDDWCYGIWGDGTYIYAAMDVGGLYAYTFDGEAFTEVGSAHDIFDYGSVWGDGTYIYATCSFEGIYIYTFDGEDFTLVDTQDDGDSMYVDIWCDDTYIYAACYDEGIRAYTFNGISFSLEDTQYDGGIYYAVWGDDTYIYAACDEGVRAYAFDGEDFTLLDTGDEGALQDVWGDDTYIYACGDGLYIYTFDGDEFTYLDSQFTGTMTYEGVYGDGSYIYIPGSTEGPAETLTYQYVFPGESDSVSKNVVVSPAPSGTTLNADFTFSPSYPRVGQLVTFTDISTGSVTSWSWTFGDGTRVIGKNQQHIYNRVGSFTVTLEVSDGSDTDSVSKTITVREGTASGPHVVFPMDPAYPDNPYTVPEMYDLLHVSDLPVSTEHITIVFLDSGFTPREYDGVDLSMIYGMKNSVYTTTDDGLGHGTWVSYAIKYITDLKIPNADIISYRVFDDSGYCDAEVLLDALDEVEALQPDIVSFSGGAYGDPYDVYSAKIDEMRSRGIIVIVAAGNEGPEASTLLSPGCSNGALGIGAIDPFFTLFDLSDDVVCGWSSRGPIVGANPPKPDFASPGESIIGPWLNSEKVVSGTSMATPLMAGGVAVVYADNKILLDTVGSMWGWLIPNIVPDIVEDSIANTAYQKGDENSYGYGIPDFQAASTAIFVNCIMWLSLFILMILCFVVLCILVSFYFKAQKCRKTV